MAKRCEPYLSLKGDVPIDVEIGGQALQQWTGHPPLNDVHKIAQPDGRMFVFSDSIPTAELSMALSPNFGPCSAS